MERTPKHNTHQEGAWEEGHSFSLPKGITSGQRSETVFRGLMPSGAKAQQKRPYLPQRAECGAVGVTVYLPGHLAC